jgi:uncharacterized protein (DUF2141 family)
MPSRLKPSTTQAIACLAASLLTPIAPALSYGADLTVLIDNVSDDSGHVLAAIFDKPDTFPNAMLRGERVAATERDSTGRVRLMFTGLAPGRYAVSAFHDRDDNGKLNANMMGLPTEPYGFSRDAKGSFGPPAFEDAAVDVPEAGLTITLRVQ